MLSSLSVEGRAAAWTKILQEPANRHSTAVYLAEHAATLIGFGFCGAQRTASLKSKGYDGEFSAVYVLREFQKRKIRLSEMTQVLLLVRVSPACYPGAWQAAGQTAQK